MRVLQINQRYYGTGAENVMRALGEALSRLGHTVCYAVSRMPSDEPKNAFVLASVPNLVISFLKTTEIHLGRKRALPLDEPGMRLMRTLGLNLRLFMPSDDLIAGLKMSSLLDGIRPDVVHGHNILGFSLSPIISPRKRIIPVLLTIHGPWPACPLATMMKLNDHKPCSESDWDACSATCSSSLVKVGRYMEKVKRTILDGVSCMVTVSDYVRRRLLDFGYPNDRIRVIHNGIDTGLYKPMNHNEDHRHEVIHAGRLSYYKGTHILLEAAKILEKERPEILIRLVGSGVGSMEKRRNLVCEGWVSTSRLVELYSHALCVVVPSIRPEPFPLIPLEAMACGTPVIGSDNGGMKESILDGITGFLVEAGDPEAIAEKIAYLHDNYEVRRTMGANAREHVERKFSTPLMVSKYMDVYKRLVSEDLS